MLHVFFIAIEETEEHLARLRAEHVSPADDSPARSKVSGTSLVIRPIDATAARVAPGHPEP